MSRNGFTLVEVAFAIAVLAFVLVTLIGLLTVGLSTQKSSSEDTRLAAMVGYVIATERMKPFATVCSPTYTTSTPYYFDLQGNTNAQSASYLQCSVSNVSSLSGNSSFLGIGNGNTNIAPMKAVFTYPLPSQVKTNVFYFNRSNE